MPAAAAGHRENRRPVPLAGSAFVGTTWEQARFFTLLAFLTVCLLTGGASRADVDSLLPLRIAAIIGLLILSVSPGAWEFRRFRGPFILLGLFAATIAIQLVPLPPGLWASLPGFARYAEAEAAAGLTASWHPISLAPDLTLNSLLALLPCLVVLVGFAGIREDQRQALLPVLVGFVGASALLGVIQFAGGPDSPAYFYAITNDDAPVGFFANRNHQAVFLAMALPMLAVWAATPARSRQHQRARYWIALALGLLLLALIVASGSRAGVIAAVGGLAAAFWLAPSVTAGWAPRWRLAFRIGAVLIPLLLVLLVIFAGRAASIFRLTDAAALNGELRIDSLPILADMLKQFSPQGIGYGAFDPVFRGFEPDAMLAREYFNHAHNDLIELALTGGLLAVAVLLLFAFWWGRRTLGAVRADRRRTADRLARLGAMMILILLGASLFDYPLRTPLLAAIFTIACCWLSAPRGAAGTDGEVETDEARPVAARQPRVSPVRIGIGLLGALALGFVTMGVTLAANLGRGRPAAVAWWPLDATANASRAARVMENPRATRAQLAAATEEARAALSREPVNAAAARTLGLLAARRGDEAGANRLMRYSESLSRRDLPTQLWMIEGNVQRNDIPGALRHYDRALRTSDNAQDMLFPILIQAAASPAVTPQLGQLLGTRPFWWRDFATRLVADGRNGAAILSLIVAARLDPADADDRALLAAAIARLVDLTDYPRALELYRRAGGAANVLVRNGDFEAENRFMPLDWGLNDGGGVGGIVQPVGSGRALLMLVEAGSSGGAVARQLLVLPPGAYRLGAVAGRVSGAAEDRPKVLLACVRDGPTLLDLRLPEAGEQGQALTGDFTVGGNCPAQWLIVAASRPTGDNGPWIDRISVQPRR